MEINYKKIANYYSKIISSIYTACESAEKSYWDEDNKVMIYGRRYNEAYAYLQKAEWRLSSVFTLKDYYIDDDFKYYGLEILQEVRHRIQHYLDDPSYDLSHLPEEVYEYTDYDDVIIDYYNSIRNDQDSFVKWKYYKNLEGYVIQKKHIVNTLKFALERLEDVNRDLNHDLYSKFSELVSDELKEEIYYLSELTSKALHNVEAIDIVEKLKMKMD